MRLLSCISLFAFAVCSVGCFSIGNVEGGLGYLCAAIMNVTMVVDEFLRK